MNQTAEIINIDQENSFVPIIFELNPKAIAAMVKEYETLELIPGDKESYKTIHEAKMICVKARTGTDKRRKELGADAREWIKDVNSKAQELIAPLLPLEERLKGMLDEEDQREAKNEADRVNKIQSLLEDLEVLATVGLQYNKSKDGIANALGRLESFEVSAVDFQEKTEYAEQIKADGIQNTQLALKNRIDWEETQADQARIAEENAAKEKALAEEKAAFEAARVAEREKQDAIQKKLDEERRVKDLEIQKINEKHAEKLRLQQEQLDRDRKAIEVQQQAARAEKDRIAFERYSNEYDEAVKLNLAIINDSAIEINASYDKARAEDEAAQVEKLKADKKRAKLIAGDKEILISAANILDRCVSDSVDFSALKTDEAQKMAVVLVGILKGTIHSFEETARGLV